MGRDSGVQGWPLRSGRRRVVEVPPSGWTPPPRGKGSTHPGRISLVWNVATPLRSGRKRSARSADREEGATPQREQDGPRSERWQPKGGRKPRGTAGSPPVLLGQLARYG